MRDPIHTGMGKAWVDGWRVIYGPLRVIKRGMSKGMTECWIFTPGRIGGDFKKIRVNDWTDWDRQQHGRVKVGSKFEPVEDLVGSKR